jgi:hypothetical protein
MQSQQRDIVTTGLAHTSFAMASPQTRTAPKPKASEKTTQRIVYRRSSLKAVLTSHIFEAGELKLVAYINILSRHGGVDDLGYLKDDGRSLPNIPRSRRGSRSTIVPAATNAALACRC